MSTTQKDAIREFIAKNPGKTATEIAHGTGLKTSNVSSVLVKGFYAGSFRREKPLGTKGWIYFLV